MLGIFRKIISLISTQPHDAEVEHYRKMFEGKILVDECKTKINRNHIFWVGRSEFDEKQIRLGVEFLGKRRYFYDLATFREDPRCGELQLMTPQEADALELRIVAAHAAAKLEKKAKKVGSKVTSPNSLNAVEPE